jgi:hypothetical protein
MYYTTGQYKPGSPKVEYRESHDSYLLKIDESNYIILKPKEIEDLYHEMLGAMMHRRYSREEVAVKEESWAN